MEIKDYSVVASNIEKANELLNETRTIVNKEVSGIVGNAMSKMGKWFFETCFPCTKTPDTTEYSSSWSVLGKIRLLFTYSRGVVRIDIKDGRFKVRDGSSGFCYCIPGHMNTQYGKGFYTTSAFGPYWHDEETILNIAKHWAEIKTKIEEYVSQVFEIAKDDAIEKAAEIQKSVEVARLLKDFEA